MDKKGDIAIGEIGKILIVVVILVIMVVAVMLLFRGKGGGLLDSIKSMLRFGRAFLAWL